jgi:hypothetical protein
MVSLVFYHMGSWVYDEHSRRPSSSLVYPSHRPVSQFYYPTYCHRANVIRFGGRVENLKTQIEVFNLYVSCG